MKLKKTIIFPIAGFGNRFLEKGYYQTKPLIHAGSKTIIEWAVDSIRLREEYDLIFVVRKQQCLQNGIDSFLKNKYPNCKIVILTKSTDGSLETIYLALNELNIKDGQLYIHTSDIVVPQKIDLEKTFLDDEEAITYTFKANNNSYSYCNFATNSEDKIIGMVEKEVVSNKANIGLYGFKSVGLFLKYAESIFNKKEKVKGEYYVSSVFDYYFKANKLVIAKEVPEVHIIGTPVELEFFKNFVLRTMNPTKIGLVSDHSGFQFKKRLMKMFDEKYKIIDYGCYSTENCDYSDYIPIACEGLAESEVDLVIASCFSGQGVTISANHIKGVCAINAYDKEAIILGRKHNCPNFIAFPSMRWNADQAYQSFIDAYEIEHFEGGRHSSRLQKVLF